MPSVPRASNEPASIAAPFERECDSELVGDRGNVVQDFLGMLVPTSPEQSRPFHKPATWLDYFPLPAALLTRAGQIAAVNPELTRLVGEAAVSGRPFSDLLWPESREPALRHIAECGTSVDRVPIVTVTATGTRFALHVGMPLGQAASGMRVAALCSVEHALSSPRRSSIPAPPAFAEDPLRALSGLPLTALILADGRVTGITQRAAALLGIPESDFHPVPLEDLLGTIAAAELFANCTGADSNWHPRALPAYPVRVEGSVRATASCLLPFGRPEVGLLLLEGWRPSLEGSSSRASSAG
ncbi:MAG TPA: PAS domain-containing protein, partial [Polyangiaceae bacterium]|nr:PAS domain-containing protein [Polyangiaceae bacterium]